MKDFNNLRLAMFSGKGGVGKTTISCGFARQWAKNFPEEQILLVSTSLVSSLSNVLQINVNNSPKKCPDLPNLQVRSFDANLLLNEFKERHGEVLQLLVSRGSFVDDEDLTPVWDLNWPGIDELMGILEIERLFNEEKIDRVVVDLAPSGHSLNLFGMLDFLDTLFDSLGLFQEQHRVIAQTFSGKYNADEADDFLELMKSDLAKGRALLNNTISTGCLVVAIAEPMSLLESNRFINSLHQLNIPFAGLFVNKIIHIEAINKQLKPENLSDIELDQYSEQQTLLNQLINISENQPLIALPLTEIEPVGLENLDTLFEQNQVLKQVNLVNAIPLECPAKIAPFFPDFITENKQLILLGGKGGVGKSTVAAGLGWHLAQKYPEKKIRIISIDPAHSLGDAFGITLAHEAMEIDKNLSGQEIDAEILLTKFREDYLWELAEMMSGKNNENSAIQIAYTPEAWRNIVSQALPGIDEMLAIVAVIELLEKKEQDLIIVDTAPTGHLLNFLEMPTALTEWLNWIFKLWIKYQNILSQVKLMGKLRNFRKQIVNAQKKLQNPEYSEFIAVTQAQSTIISETQMLVKSVKNQSILQRYLVHNRYQPELEINPELFPDQTIIRLPTLPRCIPPLTRVKYAANLLFDD